MQFKDYSNLFFLLGKCAHNSCIRFQNVFDKKLNKEIAYLLPVLHTSLTLAKNRFHIPTYQIKIKLGHKEIENISKTTDRNMKTERST